MVPLIVSVLTRLPFAEGMLLHEHGDYGLHSHAVSLDDLREGDLCAAWHHHHDGDHAPCNDNHSGSCDTEHSDSLLVIVNHPTIATGVHNATDTVIASTLRFSSRVWSRSMPQSDPPNTRRFLTAAWPSAHPQRPAFALDALLQSSHALLL